MKGKIIHLLLIAVILCSAFTGCEIFNANAEAPTEGSKGKDIVFAEPTYKTFSVDGIVLKLPDSFQKAVVDGRTGFYDKNSAVLLAGDVFTAHPSLPGMSLDEYGNAIISGWNVDAEIKIIDGLYCFEYETVEADSTTKYNYFVVLYKSNQAFWIVEFATEFWRASALRPKFISWAKMIEFTD